MLSARGNTYFKLNPDINQLRIAMEGITENYCQTMKAYISKQINEFFWG